MKSDELRRLIAEAESEGSTIFLDRYLKLHYKHFATLIDAAEYFVGEKVPDLTDRNRYSALYDALKPFAEKT